jgi:hypothetical protein
MPEHQQVLTARRKVKLLRQRYEAQGRYFLERDSSSHWYIVPVSRREEWEHWVNLDEDDEASWDEPDFVQRLGGSPTLVTFKEPEIE